MNVFLRSQFARTKTARSIAPDRRRNSSFDFQTDMLTTGPRHIRRTKQRINLCTERGKIPPIVFVYTQNTIFAPFVITICIHTLVISNMEGSDDIVMICEDNDVTRVPCHDECMPGIDPVSESDDSSYDGASREQAPDISHRLARKKRVSWDCIHTREFALVVGDHPLCQDGLPVSLDWQHVDDTKPAPKIVAHEAPVRERKHSYVFPKRLSYQERRQRLCSVSGFTDDQVKNDEIDLVVRTLKESWDCMDHCGFPPSFDPAPLADDDTYMMPLWDDVISQDIDIDLSDITDFEWSD